MTFKKIIGPVILAFCLSATPALAQQQPGPEQIEQMRQFIGLMEGYYSIIDGVHAIASNADKSAILQLQKIEEIYKQRGDRAQAIEVLRDAMAKTSSATVRNAASIMLADALNETGQASEAVEVLRQALEANLR